MCRFIPALSVPGFPNKESDDINATITALNQKMAALKLGIEVWIGPWAEDTQKIQIGFAKIDNTLELATRDSWLKNEDSEEPFDEEDETLYRFGDPKPLLRASCSQRIDGLNVVSQIIDKLRKKAEAHIDTIRRAKKMVADL
jgi:hypothetical protein